MEEKVVAGIKGILEKTNLFIILQILWLIEIYYLGINVALNILKNLMGLNFEIPIKIIDYNNRILAYLNDYKPLIFALSMAFLMCGLFGVFIRHISFISKYKLINMYADFGIYCGTWLLFIYYTYCAYEFSGNWFIVIPAFIWVMIEIKEKIKEKAVGWLNNRGITIG